MRDKIIIKKSEIEKTLGLMQSAINGALDGLELDNRDDVIEKSVAIEQMQELQKMVVTCLAQFSTPAAAMPSDEEITQACFEQDYDKGVEDKAFHDGAKWLRDRLLQSSPKAKEDFQKLADEQSVGFAEWIVKKGYSGLSVHHLGKEELLWVDESDYEWDGDLTTLIDSSDLLQKYHEQK